MRKGDRIAGVRGTVIGAPVIGFLCGEVGAVCVDLYCVLPVFSVAPITLKPSY